ncbi:MAG: HAD family phosphatase [Gemmatimonadota bacterium]
MPRFPLIVFDMDGVLVDSVPCHARAYQELWTRIGEPNGPSYDKIAGVRTVQVVQETTAHRHPSDAEVAEWVKFKSDLARECLKGLPAFPDMIPSLEKLRTAGCRFAVGTGASRATADLLLRQSRLIEFFPVVVTADDVTRGKPDPETFLQAIAKAGGDPVQSLVVEDSDAGLAAGAAAGAYTASVRSGEMIEHPRFLGSFPDVRSLTGILLELSG